MALQVRAAVESVRSNGFINYYGLQRFGSGDNATHLCVAYVASLSKWHRWVATQMQPLRAGVSASSVCRTDLLGDS